MSASCCETPISSEPGYGRVLWVALVVNALMFVVEVSAVLRVFDAVDVELHLQPAHQAQTALGQAG